MSRSRTTFFALVAAASMLMAGVQALDGEPPMPEAASVAVGEALVDTAARKD